MPRITRIWLVLLLGLWLPTGCAKPPAEPLNPPQKALAECLDLASEVAKHGFPEESEKFFTLGEIALIHQHLWALSTNAGQMRLRIRRFSNPKTSAEASHFAVSRNIVLSTRQECRSMRVGGLSSSLISSGVQNFSISPGKPNRTGSHNVVVGRQHNFSRFGGLVVGQLNTISGDFAVVSGGRENTARGTDSAVSGGVQNTASGEFAAISGGVGNTASGDRASVSGGSVNTASGDAASVCGGGRGWLDASEPPGNTANGFGATVCGGSGNTASGNFAVVSGGQGNAANGDFSSVSGGQARTAEGEFDWVTGDLFEND